MSTVEQPTIKLITGSRDRYQDLLLLGDEDPAMLAQYRNSGALFGALIAKQPVGCALCVPIPGGVELKNLAVVPEWQRQGIGSALIRHCLAEYRGRGQLVVGTGDADDANLRFYQQNGFRRCGVRRGFFDAYQPPVIVAGIQLVDMVLLTRAL